MKKTLTSILLIAVLAVLLVGGTLLYQNLSAPAPAETPAPTEAPTEAPAPAAAPETEAPAPAEPGPFVLSEDPAADFTVQDEAGNTVSLSDYFGKPIIVNFWATWCPPCRSELPAFDEAFAQYGDRVQFLMVDLTDGYSDTVESATAFARDENGYAFPLYFDVDFSGTEAWQINAIPVTLFIRADGSLLYKQVGMLDESTLARYLSQLLEE